LAGVEGGHIYLPKILGKRIGRKSLTEEEKDRPFIERSRENAASMLKRSETMTCTERRKGDLSQERRGKEEVTREARFDSKREAGTRYKREG